MTDRETIEQALQAVKVEYAVGSIPVHAKETATNYIIIKDKALYFNNLGEYVNGATRKEIS